MTGRLTPAVAATDHATGPSEALITLVEFGDYECPFCGQAYPDVREVQRRLGEFVRVVFRNFPLSQEHPHARQAAHAAEAAALQGQFWEMHDLLYENQSALESDDLLVYARALGLDLGRFQRDAASEPIVRRVQLDFRNGVRSGVNGTPTFFINGQRYDGPWYGGALLDTLESLLAEASSPNLIG